MRAPHLNLSQKGVLLVAVPLCLLCVFYFGLKLRLNAVRQHMTEVEKRMAIVSNISNVELKAFFAFQSLLQLKLHGKMEERVTLNKFLENLQRDETRLVGVLRNEEQNPHTADDIDKKFRSFMFAFQKSNFNPNAENEVGSIIRSLDENQKFLTTAGTFFESMSSVARIEQLAADDSRSRLQSSRRELETWIDVVVLSTLAITVFTSVQFFRGTVKKLMRLKENSWRFVDGKELLSELGTADEVGDVDHVFHEMVATIRASQARDSHIMSLLQESKERLDVVLNNLPIAVIVTDAKGIIESINPAAARLFEYSPSEIKGNPIAKLFPVLSQDHMLVENMQDVLPVQLEGEAKNQDLIFTEVQKKTITNQDGETILFAVQDVSERRNLERLTKDFYAMVSHDIRSPLHAIDGTLEIALSKKYGAVSQELAERLSGARRNISRLLELVNKLLVIERLEGAVNLTLSKVEISEVVADALELHRQRIEAKYLVIKANLPAISVMADKQYLMQVASNLIENAIKFSPEKGRLLIHLHELSGYAELFIRDEGPGVPEQMREEIFERFRQNQNGVGASQGFGLGLAICKQIVQKHGGTIGIRDCGPTNFGEASADGSIAGKGCEFWVRFKLYS